MKANAMTYANPDTAMNPTAPGPSLWRSFADDAAHHPSRGKLGGDERARTRAMTLLERLALDAFGAQLRGGGVWND